MNTTLLSAGLFVFGFTLLFLMPAGMMKTWKELGSKPLAGDTTVLIMRFMGLLLIVAGVLFLLGIIDMASFAPPHKLTGTP